jgi:hypothetical protein
MKPTRGIVGQPASELLAGLPEGADAPMATDPLHREVVPSVATSDGALTYEFVPSQGDRGVLVESLPGTGSNLRMVWTVPNTLASRDHQVCDAWGETDGPITQQGVSLRIYAKVNIQAPA